MEKSVENLENIKKAFDTKKFRKIMESCSVSDMSINRKVIGTFKKDFWKEFIQDETRRKQGEFFTPTIWVNEGHKMISQTFGDDWKEEYVVWDCAAGTGNLTRDYKFKELYCSTLVGSDIETMEQAGYNPEAVKFQYDFLNDGIIDGKIDVAGDMKLPLGLKNAISEGKKIIFFINPPYAAAGEKNFKGNKKCNISKTNVSDLMKKDKWGKCSENLYAQFIYYIYKINKFNKNIKIVLFSPISFMISPSYKELRKSFYKDFSLKYGFLMNSSEFTNVKTWGLTFSIWDYFENNKDIILDIKEINNYDFIIKRVGIKKVSNIDENISLKNWIEIESKSYKNYNDEPLLSTALNIVNNKYRGKSLAGSLGWFFNHNNNIEKNSTSVSILSSTFSQVRGNIITSENFKKSTIGFCARKSITDINNYKNQKDEYLAPTEEVQNSPQYKQFEVDSIVYSLFNTSSNQSSMRQVEYKDKLWDIKNEFFFMSKDEMKALAEQHKFDELYKDARMSDERYVYNLLQTTNLSKDAKDVLETSRELVRKSFEWRKIMHQTNPEYHLHSWDAGWYQIKKILNQHFKDELSSFNAKYKVFENRMRPQVYQLGFLIEDIQI